MIDHLRKIQERIDWLTLKVRQILQGGGPGDGPYLPLAGGQMEPGATIQTAEGAWRGEGPIQHNGFFGLGDMCIAGYFQQWANGSRYVYDASNKIRETTNQFNAPTSDDDETRGVKVGTRWVLDSGEAWVCDDATEGAAVWVPWQVPAENIPAIAVVDYLGPVVNQTAMLALVGQSGDWCVRSDEGKVYVITGEDPTELSSWTALTYPALTQAQVTALMQAAPGDFRTAMGLGGAATLNVGATTGTVAAGDDARLSDARVPRWTRLANGDSDYTIVATGSVLVEQTGTISAARFWDLPAASSVGAGAEVIVQGGAGITATNTLSIRRAGSDTINGGSANVVIGTAYGWRRLVSDGVSAWHWDAGVLRSSENLAGLANTTTARSNLGLGTMAVENIASISGAVVPDGSITRDLGSSAASWNNCYSWVVRAADVRDAFASTWHIAFNAIRQANSTALGWTSQSGAINANLDTQLRRGAAGILRITGATAGDLGGGIEMLQIASGGTPASNSARIYAKDVSGTAEMFVMDEAGNETQISSHSATAPSWLYTSGEPSPVEAVGYSANYYQGVVTYTHRETGRVYRETFAEHNERLELTGDRALTLWDWDDIQVGHVAKRNEERAEWQSKRDAWEALPEEGREEWTGGEIPTVYVAKPKPDWAEDQGAAIVSTRAAEAIEQGYQATITAGFAVDPEGFSIAMDEADVTRWSNYLVELREREVSGEINAQTEIPFLDNTGTPRQAALTRFRQIALGAGAAWKAAFFARAAALAALQNP
jgi:hypothetical protein